MSERQPRGLTERMKLIQELRQQQEFRRYVMELAIRSLGDLGGSPVPIADEIERWMLRDNDQ